MYAIQMPTGEFLDVPENFQIPFELNNQVFSSSDVSSLAGSFSFPVEIGLNKRNRRLLGFPDVITNANTFREFDGVRVYGHGVFMFPGLLQITSAANSKARINIILTPFRKLKEISLNELDLGGDRVVTDWPEHMYDTAYTPELFDYAFLPVFNAAHNGYEDAPGNPDNVARYYVNYYDYLTEAYHTGSAAISPMVRVDYLLRKIFESDSYQFKNEWQSDIELQLLYLFNSIDVRVVNAPDPPELPGSFNLRRHVPGLKATEFLKALISQWGLGLFPNLFAQQVSLVSIQTVLRRPTVIDWTPYAYREYSIDATDDAPVAFNHEQPAALPPFVPAVETLRQFELEQDLTSLFPTFDIDEGFYYVESYNAVVEVREVFGSLVIYRKWPAFKGVRVATPGSTYTPSMTVLPCRYAYPVLTTVETPAIASRWHETGPSTWEWRDVDFPLSVLLYRGLQNNPWAPFDAIEPTPMVTNGTRKGEYIKVDISIVSGGLAVKTTEYGLNWDGPQGLYATHHGVWNQMLRTGKPISKVLDLPLSELLQFSFDKKVRIDNMDYFLSKMKIQRLLPGNRVEVEIKGVSVI